MANDPQAVTEMLIDVQNGNRSAVDRLLPVVYDELRDLAGRYIQRESPGITLQPTALVHEAYVKLIDQSRVNWQGRTHFFAVGAQAMRRILVDHARARRASNGAVTGSVWPLMSTFCLAPSVRKTC